MASKANDTGHVQHSHRKPADERIRISYVSADLHEHATAYLAAELFELHDRARFEVTGISLGREDSSPMRQRLVRAFDRFVDVRQLSDTAAAEHIQNLGIDIAVDLKGFTKDCRPQIFAHRPAPIQVNYLGYPGTMGALFMDYILVDPFIAPHEQQQFYNERLVQLPDCYQINDRNRTVDEQTPTREECGLPKDGFIYCSFNNSYKLNPDIFRIWMRLLEAVPGSVLWLLSRDQLTQKNLRREAAEQGTNPARLVFAPHCPLPKHLARQKLADLFLDTLPCNAHTTASDALWVGLPVLTCAGQSFASRVAGSLLHAIGLPELVTYSLEEYQALAVKLATQPTLLGQIRNTLENNRSSYPLFDADRFRRHIEAAYTEMYSIWQRGEAPRAITLPAPQIYTQTP